MHLPFIGGEGGSGEAGGYDPDSGFFILTGKCLAACAGLFTLQYIPITGVFLMMVGGPFWIGLVVHYYFVQVAWLGLRGRIGVYYLALPLAFYGAGIAAGANSDMHAEQWKAGKRWIEIQGTIDASVNVLAFEPWNMLQGRVLGDAAGAWRPEDVGFEMAMFHRLAGTKRFVPQAESSRACGGDRFGDRCFTREDMELPAAYLEVGARSNVSSYVRPQVHEWGTVYSMTTPLVLKTADREVVVGELRGALLRKNHYFLFPTAGCALNSAAPSWQCGWWVFARMRDERIGFYPSATGSSPDTAALLMSALREVKGVAR